MYATFHIFDYSCFFLLRLNNADDDFLPDCQTWDLGLLLNHLSLCRRVVSNGSAWIGSRIFRIYWWDWTLLYTPHQLFGSCFSPFYFLFISTHTKKATKSLFDPSRIFLSYFSSLSLFRSCSLTLFTLLYFYVLHKTQRERKLFFTRKKL